MKDMESTEVRTALGRLYDLFASRPAGNDYCGLCWGPEEVAYLTTTPVQAISDEMAGKLLWETGDHWQNPEVYQHYLPRMLEALAPPGPVDDCYPLHLFETLEYLGFAHWAAVEKEAVYAFLDAVTPVLPFHDAADREEWEQGCARIGKHGGARA